ncbi:hypothetical protein Lfu02_77260 [Longispora fulva]|uniref:Uncharacterized protein n=1 Tax=Longispora fulva TaxID=619741 RepID=A0A8J7GSD3_9ACTN|nr:hypothetical protein [Longispora fulva]GIG63354.1 hypothetical protein Lfu02_77260 [Longispora fulva]
MNRSLTEPNGPAVDPNVAPRVHPHVTPREEACPPRGRAAFVQHTALTETTDIQPFSDTLR